MRCQEVAVKWLIVCSRQPTTGVLNRRHRISRCWGALVDLLGSGLVNRSLSCFRTAEGRQGEKSTVTVVPLPALSSGSMISISAG